ncbi:Bromodomain [Trypanosoma vivax]|uniref:Bromo domain-containing protein n=1 Tax=Trypanosoma vivax (strain Y486) TaxID=1055687 RepID=G0UCP5_TRYVY|nr:hypothetical protein TRVL_00336 [Trypanosoma vivax]KAH8607913.1 Bromodomain [Trypanosoma vivax]CCC53605.1 conserved hypothetical protein [Trypanosoma vivax Y486]
MSVTGNKIVDEINYWISYVDCALEHPQPLPRGKHVYRSDLNAVPEVRDLYDCLYKLYTEEETSEHFREPVDALKLGVFNYYKVVTNAMSLRTILDRIAEGGRYSRAAEVMEDVELIWSNCKKFNGADSPFAIKAKECAVVLAKLRERLADEQLASPTEVDRLVHVISCADDTVISELETYFLREDPSLILRSGEVDISSLRVKHVRAMREILQRAGINH